MKQNIYDNFEFFEGYKKIRKNENSANNIEEKPALFALLPDLRGKKVLDLGCGYGENCKAFSQMGASFVMGIDISDRMLEVAEKENNAGNISFVKMCMEDIICIEDKFDVIVSSLAVHYIADFDKLVSDIFNLLCPAGVFVFSQEHPITTASKEGVSWAKNEGEFEVFCLNNYSCSGRREITWIVDDVIKYHRTFSEILNNLISAGFIIDCVSETVPDALTIDKLPAFSRCLHVPDFLLIRAIKTSC